MGTCSGPDRRANSSLRLDVRRMTDQSTVTVRIRLLSATTRPSASKMRPRSGAM